MLKKINLEIPEVFLVEPTTFKDERGFFREIGRNNIFQELGLPTFVQENHSRSSKHVARGLHYQTSPKQVAKLVRCIRGEIFDVAVDIRPYSGTYSQWVGQYLSGTNGRMLYIPKGFAHGFCVISKNGADVIYSVTDYYSSEHDKTIRLNDEEIGIKWPVKTKNLLVSDKDFDAPSLRDAEPIE
jgi:dTDP-4-dehydrorhamnose 3,5-epimerase